MFMIVFEKNVSTASKATKAIIAFITLALLALPFAIFLFLHIFVALFAGLFFI